MKCAMEVLIFSYLIGQKWRGDGEGVIELQRGEKNLKGENILKI